MSTKTQYHMHDVANQFLKTATPLQLEMVVAVGLSEMGETDYRENYVSGEFHGMDDQTFKEFYVEMERNAAEAEERVKTGTEIGHWDMLGDAPVVLWRWEAEQGETRLGYHQWRAHRLAEEAHEREREREDAKEGGEG